MGHDDEDLNPVLIQTLAKIPGLCYFSNFYWKVIATADPRAEDYAMMHNPDTPASVVLAYMLMSLLFGPRIMRSRQTPRMTRPLLLAYNVIVIHVNGFLAIALTHHVVSSGYNIACQPVEPAGKSGDWVMTLLYGFYCSKILELVDTLFLVLKKKSSQLTFLHIYHHSTILAATWIGVKFVPGGTTTIIALINSWVHVFMYAYYEMMAADVKISRKYKQFLTIMQITQFCFTLVVCSVAMWVKDCGYPKWVLWWLFLYMMSFLILFGKFFVDTYKCGKQEDSDSESEIVHDSCVVSSQTLYAKPDALWKSCSQNQDAVDDDDDKEWENISTDSSMMIHSGNVYHRASLADRKRPSINSRSTKEAVAHKRNGGIHYSLTENDFLHVSSDTAGIFEKLQIVESSHQLNGSVKPCKLKRGRKPKSHKSKGH